MKKKLKNGVHAFLPMELKATAEGVFSGYASVFNIEDSQGDVILKGAFANSLKKNIGDIKLLWQHDFSEPIGIIEDLREDAKGLYVKARLLLDVARGKEAYSLVKSGAIKGLSIGYVLKRHRYDSVSGLRLIEDLDLLEVSIVTFPANQSAGVSAVKSAPRTAYEVASIRNGDIITLHDSITRATNKLCELIGNNSVT